jgi:cellulose synthase/poly-beta-1,6-N-acetylglucosamine synthase-like glycosyltransferase
MAFPWPVLRDAPALGGHLAEDMVLGIELALRGTPPLACPAVSVSSDLPKGAQVQLRQRRRWEHGHLAVIRQYGPRLLWSGFTRASGMRLAMALDLMVPPLALLTMLLGLAGLASTITLALGGSGMSLVILVASGLTLGIGIVLSWARFARAVLPLRVLATVPLYLLWKAPLYASYLVRGGIQRWERTVRAGEASGTTKPSPGPTL